MNRNIDELIIDAISEVISSVRIDKKRVQFPEGPFNRKAASFRVYLPKEYISLISTFQGNKDIACIMLDEAVVCYPVRICDKILKTADAGFTESSKSAARRLESPLNMVFMLNCNSEINSIELHNRLYLSKRNPLRSIRDIAIEGFDNYFLIKKR